LVGRLEVGNVKRAELIAASLVGKELD